MTLPAPTPSKLTQGFGSVTATIDVECRDCVIRAPMPGPVHPVFKTMRLHSVEEIEATYQVQKGLSATNPIAADIARALEFAGTFLRNLQDEDTHQ